MTVAAVTDTLNLGFLTVVQESGAYVGGYLVTNNWGRPLEFRLTTAVQPNRIHQVLYARTLQPYICSDLIGKTLVEKTNIPVQIVLTDTADALDLRCRLDIPVILVCRADEACPVSPADPAPVGAPLRDGVRCHPHYTADAPRIAEILDRLTGIVDLTEPFQRIREAMGEARKLGVGRK